MSKNNVHHERTKHVVVKYYFIQEKIEECSVKVSKISTLHNHVDIFTKVLPVNKVTEASSLLLMRRFMFQYRGKIY